MSVEFAGITTGYSEQDGKVFETESLGKMNESKYGDLVRKALRPEVIREYLDKERFDTRKFSRISAGEIEKMVAADFPREIEDEIEENGETVIAKRRFATFNDYINSRIIKILRNPKLPILDDETLAGLIEKSQTGSPDNPEPQFALDLHGTLADELGVNPESDDLQFFTSVDSKMEIWGIDGFFKLKYINSRNQPDSVRVFFDLTIDTVENKEKKIADKLAAGGRFLADSVLYMTGIKYYDRSKHRELLPALAEKLARSFREKIENKNKLLKPLNEE